MTISCILTVRVVLRFFQHLFEMVSLSAYFGFATVLNQHNLSARFSHRNRRLYYRSVCQPSLSCCLISHSVPEVLKAERLFA